ncbi:MAG: sulfatase-like hydrolase/transferase, partial [Terriglobus sp.]
MNRRDFLVSSGAAAATSVSLGMNAVAQKAAAKSAGKTAGRKPNIILYLSDQFRWDFVGANGANSSTKTPNLDAMAKRGKNFTHAVTNQPVCAPARSVLMTSRYATETGVWHNGPALDNTLPTLAGELRK